MTSSSRTGRPAATADQAGTGAVVPTPRGIRRTPVPPPGVPEALAALVEGLDDAGRDRDEQLGRVAERADQLSAVIDSERATYTTVLEQIEEHVWSVEVDEDGGLHRRYTSPSAAAIFGGEPPSGSDIDTALVAMVPAEHHERLRTFLADLRAGRPTAAEVPLVGRDGELRWVWARAVPRRAGGRLIVDGVTSNVTERHELAAKREQLRRLEERQARRAAVLADRERIATDVHDHVLQRLFAAGLQLALLRSALPEEQAARVTAVAAELDASARDIRDIILGLRLVPAEEGLEAGLEQLVDRSSQVLGFRPFLAVTGDRDRLETLDPLLVEAATGAASEAVSNIVRHARADRVTLALDVTRRGLRLTITDNGVGMPEDPPPGSGLLNLRRRAERWGGSADWRPTPGGGVTIEWRVPVV